MKRACWISLAMLLSIAAASGAQPRTEYRGFWVDTFNTSLNTHDDVAAVVNNAIAARANAIFAQVRRRGDAFYVNALEPPPDFVPIAAGFDPLQDLIDLAHANGIEVHAFVIVGAIWNKNPTYAPTATLGPPTNPNHVFNLHGGYDAVAKTVLPGPENWLTRTLLPNWAFNGYRFGNDFWIDLGHPDAEAYTVDVLMNLVKNYDIDGLHLDRIRYPDFSASGQTPSNGTNIGYNQTSVARFLRSRGLAPDAPAPATGDPQWMQWRRDQVTNFVRRLYLNAMAVKPNLKLSAALIVYGGGPVTEAEWNTKAEAYWRVYQDWRAWTEEGILDIAIPMNYKREHSSSERLMFDQWSEWTKNHAYNRATMIGPAVYLNAIEGTLRQVRRSLAPSALGNFAAGVNFYAMATTNAAVTANPFAIPGPANTPVRPFAEFASALTTGKSVDGLTLYEDPAANPVAIFADNARVPQFTWKTNPLVGHLMGFIHNEDGTVVDAGSVSLARVSVDPATAGRTARATAADGGGFYGGVDLAPGRFQVTVTPVGADPYTHLCTVDVAPGQVSSFDFTIDRHAPTVTASSDRHELWPPNGEMADVPLVVDAADAGTGLASLRVSVADEYGLVEPQVTEAATGAGPYQWAPTIQLEASRLGDDRDGRTYTVTVTATDRACNVSTSVVRVVVPHDQRAK